MTTVRRVDNPREQFQESGGVGSGSRFSYHTPLRMQRLFGRPIHSRNRSPERRIYRSRGRRPTGHLVKERISLEDGFLQGGVLPEYCNLSDWTPFESGAEAPHSRRFARFGGATSVAAASGVRRFTAAFESVAMCRHFFLT